jgi:hypothetical protein
MVFATLRHDATLHLPKVVHRRFKIHHLLKPPTPANINSFLPEKNSYRFGSGDY